MELPIVDIKGKELGTLHLTDEVENVLNVTQVMLTVEYDGKTKKVRAYLS